MKLGRKNDYSARIGPTPLIWSEKKEMKNMENNDQSQNKIGQTVDSHLRNRMVLFVSQKMSPPLPPVKQLFSGRFYRIPRIDHIGTKK